MHESRLLMGMPITVEIVDKTATQKDIDAVFDYFTYIDETFSTYKEHSEISKINRGEVALENASNDMRAVFALSEDTKRATHGYFDIRHKDHYDPSGLVKGWAVLNAATLLEKRGLNNFRIDAGGDMQLRGTNAEKGNWRVGIRNPLQPDQIIKIVHLHNKGIATSGTYLRGQHIYNPLHPDEQLTDVVSLTVIGPNVYEADRFATAAFAMGARGIHFIEQLPGFEAYQINSRGRATLTTGFEHYLHEQTT